MRTRKDITDKLERKIVANALYKFRLFKKDEINHKTLIFVSSFEGTAFDLCYVDVDAWQLKKIEYEKVNGKKITKHTISLN